MKPILYDYFVHNIGTEKEPAYKAIIPAFNNAVVYGGSLLELEDGIVFTIEEEIKELEKAKKRVPRPESDVKMSGKILIRISPVVHEKLLFEARANKKSLNKYISEKLEA